MKKLVVILACFMGMIASQNFGGEPNDKEDVRECYIGVGEDQFPFNNKWMEFSMEPNKLWLINPCEKPVKSDISEDITHNGVYYVENGKVEDRGDVSFAEWRLVSSSFGNDVESAEYTYLQLYMVQNVSTYRPQCDLYSINISFFCNSDAETPFATLQSESACEASFAVQSLACAGMNDDDIAYSDADDDEEDDDDDEEEGHEHHKHTYKHKHVRRMLLFPLFGIVLLASICCCVCIRRRRQARILESNFSNVAFQPIPHPTPQHYRSTPNVVPQHYFMKPNHIQVPSSYFATAPVQSHIVQLEDYSVQQNHIASDEQLARELQRQFDQN